MEICSIEKIHCPFYDSKCTKKNKCDEWKKDYLESKELILKKGLTLIEFNYIFETRDKKNEKLSV
ncbi:MAG: hypothetical protein WC812_01850 [Candidatus Pacearchaeota archaeon]|jgi:hypothetical protein